jgi:protein-tyrosine kinase
MAQHNILAFYPEATPDQGYLPMADEGFPPSRRDRPGLTSVFHTGTLADRDTADADLRAAREALSQTHSLALFSPARVWESLNAVTLDGDTLAGNRLFTNSKESPAGPAFDVLRTRIAQAMAEKGWRRIGITSPTSGCGSSFTAANLALSLARRPGARVVLIDLDLRRPSLHRLLGLTPTGALRDFIDGSQPMESLFVRVGRSLAIGLNADPVPDAGDLLQGPDTVLALDALDTQLDPEIVVMDLAPALLGDDVICMADKLDAVLIVADGTRTTAKEIRACEALFDGRIPVMGVVLNRAQDRGIGRLRYGKE